MDGIREKYGLSERHACRIVGQHRGTQRYVPTVPADEDALTRAIVALASDYGRYGYRRVTALLQTGGWQVGKDRVQRIWRREGLKVPSRHKPRSRLYRHHASARCLGGDPRGADGDCRYLRHELREYARAKVALWLLCRAGRHPWRLHSPVLALPQEWLALTQQSSTAGLTHRPHLNMIWQ